MRIKGPNSLRSATQRLLILVVVLVSSSNLVSADEPRETSDHAVTAFLTKHCLRCHGADLQSADLRVDNLSMKLRLGEDATAWQEVVDRLNLGEMPPPDEPQPTAEELAEVVDWIQNGLRKVQTLGLKTGGNTVLRRLNRHEYANTISELLHLPNYDPGQRFPEDATAFGFDNNGSALTMSPLLMERYLEIASEAVDRAIKIGKRPQSKLQTFDVVENSRSRSKNKYWAESVFAGKWWLIKDDHLAVRGRGVRTDVSGGYQVPHDGEYVFRIRLAGIIGKDGTVPEILVRLTNAEVARDVETLAIKNTAMQNHDVRVFLKAGRVDFRLTFANGQPLVKNLRQFDRIPEPGDDGYESEPHTLLFNSVVLEGPVVEQWPPKSFASIFSGSAKKKGESNAEQILTRFCEQAFRRPVVKEDVEPFISIYRDAMERQASHEDAIGYALKGVLCSPHFLFLVESPRAGDGPSRLNDFELASRLSYFLWSSMPDAELIDLARSGLLHEPAKLHEQVERMLSDERSTVFVGNFVGQWLELRELGAMCPSARLHRDYYNHRIEEHSRQETLRFFREVLDKNESVLNFIDSDFTMLNGPLAKWYGIDGVAGPKFRRVALPKNSPRGGVLTQASILTLTSDGTRTKPVTRGAWVLTNIVGSPPPPPPPNAGDLPVIPNKPLTVRERLDHHRNIPACASCHRKIDPLGFALDNFDMLGRYRTQEMTENGVRSIGDVDVSGRLPDGREFKTLTDFKRLLLNDKDRFARCLAEKMMTYAIGRGVEFSDRASLDLIVKELSGDEYRLRTLVHFVVKSNSFQTR